MEQTAKKTTMMTIMILLLALSAAYAQAAVVSPLSLTQGTSETRSLTGLPTQSILAQGGNVTAVNIDALSVTQSWQGYFGNISGAITLDAADNSTFYNWTLATVQGEVYATRNATADFSTANCANSTERTNEETFLGQLATDGDSVSNTFQNATHPQFNVSTTQIPANNCYDTNAFSNDVSDTTRFHQILLADGASSIIYTTIIDNGQISFDNSVADFQILVSEPSTAGTTTYYFFVELD